MSPSRWAVAGRWGLLTLLLVPLALLAPTTTALEPARTAHAAALSRPSPSPVVAPATPIPAVDERLAQVDARRPRLAADLNPVFFRDATAQFHDAPATLTGSGILVDIDTNQVMWEMNPHQERAPASTTKMMTAIVAMSNFSPDQEMVIPVEATRVQYVETRLGLIPGERLTMTELWYGMLMVSANDAALAMAYGTVGMDDFVRSMNEQAAHLGLHDTHFANPVGFPDDPGQYSSAYDLAATATAGYRDLPLFRQITATRDGVLVGSPRHQEYKLHNINRIMDIYPPAIGTKSGFTDDAGPVEVAMAERNGHHLVVVLMNAQHMFDQARALLEWGFNRDGVPPLTPLPPG